MSLKISDHDLQTKINQMQKFLEKGNKVRIMVQLKGRENYHSERAFTFGEKLVRDFEKFAIVEQAPKLSGSTMSMLFRARK